MTYSQVLHQKIKKASARTLNAILISGNSPEKVREAFLRLIFVQIGLYITISNTAEIWLRPEMIWVNLPTSLVGFFHLLILPAIWPQLPRKRLMIQIDIMTGLLFLTHRTTVVHGLHGPNLTWFIIFPVFAQAFSTLHFTFFTSVFSVICAGWVGMVNPMYFDQALPHSPFPLPVFGLIATLSILLMTYFAFLSEFVDRRIALLNGKAISKTLRDSSEQALGRVARSVVHNMRTPLSTLSLSAEFLEMKLNGIPALKTLEGAKQNIEQVVKALLYVTDSSNVGYIEEFDAKTALLQAIAACTSISHLPSLPIEINSNQDMIFLRGDRLAFSKMIWRLARILEPLLAQSTSPALFVEANSGPWGLELKLEIQQLPENSLSPPLLKDLEVQATLIRRSLLGDQNSVSVQTLQKGTLSLFLTVSSLDKTS